MSYLYGLKRPGTFGISNRILLATRTEPFKAHKIGTVIGKQGRILSLNVQIVYDVLVLRMFVHVVRNVIFLWFVGNHGTFGLQNRILLATRTEPFKTHKIGTAMGKQGRILSLNVQIVYDVLVLRIFVHFVRNVVF